MTTDPKPELDIVMYNGSMLTVLPGVLEILNLRPFQPISDAQFTEVITANLSRLYIERAQQDSKAD